MLPYLTEKFGNASSIHGFGQEARAAVERARQQAADLINARPSEIVFTSGGTESNNLAIRGLLQHLWHKREGDRNGALHIVTSAIEHSAVRMVCEDLRRSGAEVTFVPVSRDGLIDIASVRSAITEHTALVTIMTANNEIGTLQPVAEIGKLVRELRSAGRRIWFHTDAVQAVGKVAVDVEEIGCDLLSLSGHKIHAPKGIGALYIRRGTRLQPQNIGGRQERGVRGGTEPVAQIVALGAACELARERLNADAEHIGRLRDRFEERVFENIADVHRNGSAKERVPGISNISFGSIEGEALLINLDMQGVAVSTGSACSSGSIEPSPVISAIGRADDLARGAVRFSFGRQNTENDLARVLEVLPAAIENLRRLARPRP